MKSVTPRSCALKKNRCGSWPRRSPLPSQGPRLHVRRRPLSHRAVPGEGDPSRCWCRVRRIRNCGCCRPWRYRVPRGGPGHELHELLAAGLLRAWRERGAPGAPPTNDTGQPLGWRYGADIAFLRRFAERWTNGCDWRSTEARLDQPGAASHSVPLLILHGWPYTNLSYADLVAPLADPERFGGATADAFDVVVVARPGYSFSDAPKMSSPPFMLRTRFSVVPMSRKNGARSRRSPRLHVLLLPVEARVQGTQFSRATLAFSLTSIGRPALGNWSLG
jgi:hypothetical protein